MILIFSVIGTYAGTNNVSDIWVMFAFGLLGYFMTKHKFSPAGVLLGLILGPIAEDGLRDMLVVSHGSPITFMLTRPISVAILICIVMALYFSMKPQPWSGEDQGSEGSGEQSRADD